MVRIAIESGLDIVSLLFNTSYTLQPVDVLYFKPFKIVFKKIRCMDIDVQK